MAAPPLDCPVCRLVNSPSATHCDCGYDFERGQETQETAEILLAVGPVIAGGLVIVRGLWVQFRMAVEGTHTMLRPSERGADPDPSGPSAI